MIPVVTVDGIEVYHGDCLDVMPTLGVVDAVMADLPYATTRNTWDRMIDPKLLWERYDWLTGPRSPVILFGSGIFTAQMMMSNPARYRYSLVWDKQTVTGHLNAKRQPLRAHEDLLVFYDQAPPYHPQMVHTGRASHSRGRRRDRTVILDNVAGSGTTLVAARNCGRRAIGIEGRDDYVGMIADRLRSGATGDRW